VGAKSGQNAKQAGAKRLALVVFGALFVLLFVGFAIAQGLTQPSVPAGDVAHVSDVPGDIANISEEQLKRGILQQAATGGEKKAPKPGSKKYEELQASVMTELVQSVWLRAEAENLGIEVTEKQIETELANVKKQNFPTPKAYNEFLKTAHYTQDEVNEKIELSILNKKIGEKVTNEAQPASSAEIKDYYEEEKATQFTEKPTRDVRVIVNEKQSEVEKAKEALEADNSPASWKKVAKKYSSDPTTSSKGGLQKAIPEELLQGPLKKAIYGSATGELVGPTKFQGNYLLTEVVKLNPEKVKTLGEVRSQISQTLTQEKQQEHLQEFGASYQQKWISRTVCASGFEIEECSNFPDSKRIAKAREPYKACFEANPKEPATECPAPVEQTKPALPGTVTPRKPGGEPFVQRPFPEATAAAGSEALEGVEGAEGAPEEVAPEEAAPEEAAPESGGAEEEAPESGSGE
jgi:parvulin-like peptidyl-prolyl isomerase